MTQPLGGPAHLVRRAGDLARGLSEGRRRGARLALGRGSPMWTDRRDVFVAWPPPAVLTGHLQALAAAVALHASPTKDMVATLYADDFSPRQLAALQLCEGAAAVAWANERWPGLRDASRHVTGGLCPQPWQGLDARTLADRAVELARTRGPVSVPAVLGLLPLRRRPGWRLRWRRAGNAMERLGALFGGIAIEGLEDDTAGTGAPLSGEERDDIVDHDRVGIPYPEWDMTVQDYRLNHVTVRERRRANGSRTLNRPRADLEAWFTAPLDRRWRGRLDDGAEIDIDAAVDSMLDTRTGGHPSDRVYRDRLRIERDLCCAVLIDASGSLGQASMLDHSLACADALVDAMDQAGERHAVFGFSSDGRHDVTVEVLQDFHDRAVTPSAGGLRPGRYTRLGAALRHITARVLAQPARRRAILLLSDGVPFDEAYEGEYAYADTAKAVEEAERRGVTVLVLGVGDTETPRSVLGERFAPVSTVDHLASALGGVHGRLVTT